MIKTLFPAVLTCLLAVSAAAQTAVSVRTGQTSGAVAPIIPFSAAPGGAPLVSPLSGLGLTPALSAPSLAPSAFHAEGFSVIPAAMPSAIVAVKPAAAVAAKAVAPEAKAAAAIDTPQANRTAFSVLGTAAKSAAAVSEEAPARLDATFDGSVARAGDVSAVAAPLTAPRRSFLGRAALAAGVFIAQPGIALAATAPAIVEPGALALVGAYAPLATVIAAVVGALFGLWSSRGKDGSPANAGQVFSATLSHGVIAGAAAFALIDLTMVAFLGASATILLPLTATIATAALAQTAFSAKFTDPATTPADRIMGAFPAVALAFGLSVGAVALLAPVGLLALSTMTMMATAAATALYTALFKLEKSPAGGPAAMGRGFVLQALMTGLALAIGPSPYTIFFFALGMWGFASVMRTTAAEFWAAVPESFKARFKR